jgi:LmbE family N-acetylglucosaminyl deacetylase
MNILAIGAHPDDVELGCGATLAAHVARGDSVALLIMTTGEQGPQAGSSRIREQEAAAAVLGARLFWGNFRDGAVPKERSTVDLIDEVLGEVEADLIYTHSLNDTHQDHRVTARMSLSAGRRTQRLLTYEAPTSRAFSPTLFVNVEGFMDKKLDALREHHSQVLKNRLVDLDAIEAQARYRGFQARMKCAEAFAVERFAWDLFPTDPQADTADRLLASIGGGVVV